MGKTFEVKGAERINGQECRHFSNEPGNRGALFPALLHGQITA